ASWSSRRPGLGREEWGDPLPPRRGGYRRDPHHLRSFRRNGLCAPGVAVVPFAEPVLPSPVVPLAGDTLGGAHLHEDPSGPDQPRVCWSLRLRQDTAGTLCR